MLSKNAPCRALGLSGGSRDTSSSLLELLTSPGSTGTTSEGSRVAKSSFLVPEACETHLCCKHGGNVYQSQQKKMA